MWNFLKSRKRVYLDYNASTPPSKQALKGLKKSWLYWANPSSNHQSSQDPKALLWQARKHLAQFVNCSPLEVIFTSSATESNNSCFFGVKAPESEPERREIIVSSVEHPSVLEAAENFCSKQGKVHRIPVSKQGILDENFFDKVLSEKTLLVSIMSANNETGLLFPIKRLAEKAHKKGSYFHSDMVQSLGKEPIDLQALGVDFASFSAHKMYGLKGCGALYCRKGTSLKKFLHGGTQERGRRAGTENMPGVLAFGQVLKDGKNILKQNEQLRDLNQYMEARILSLFPQAYIVGKSQPRLGNTSCFYLPDIEGEALLRGLDLEGFSVSLGSACHSGKVGPSPVLLAMGFTEKEARSCLRVSFGLGITKRSVDRFLQTLENVVRRLNTLKSK